MPFVAGLRAYIRMRVPARDADDVLQDALLRMHEASDTLRDQGRAESWVFGITRRTIADYYRKSRALQELDETDLPDQGSLPENLAEFDGDHDVHEEVLSWLRPMAEDLPDHYGQALLMADFERHSQAEVAKALGLSLSGAKSRIQRARKMLGESLKSCCAVEFSDGRAAAFRRLRKD